MRLVITNQNARSEIYIAKGIKEENKKIYDFFFAKKIQIESDFQGELVWKRLENCQASKVEYCLKEVNGSKEADWGKITEFLIDSAIKMHRAFHKHIPEIKQKIKTGSA